MPKVSVIVPVYNTEKYLGKCIDSLLQQTLDDIEIILIDDCSKDNSLDIMRAYQEKSPRKIKIIESKQNAGAGTARNLGLEVATGEYIGFVDSDDYINPTMYKKMLTISIETSSDLVRTNRKLLLCGLDLSFLKRAAYEKTPLIDPREHKSFLIIEPPGVTNKLFSRNLIGNSKFPEGLKWEDYPFTVPITVEANQVATVPDRLYTYNMNLANTTLTDARKLNKNLLDIFTCSDIVGEKCLISDTNANVKRQIEYVQIQHCLIRLKEVAGANIPLQEKRELLTLLSSLIKTKYGSWQDHEIYQRQKKSSAVHRTRMALVETLLLPDDSYPKEEEQLKQLIKEKITKNTK